MNERIRELSDIAYKNHLKNNPNSSFGRRTDYDREFAELIVKECLYIVEGEDDCTDATIGVRLAMIRMKQHFGVEE